MAKKKTNWTPWLIGGAAVLGVAGAAYWYAKKNQNEAATVPAIAEQPVPPAIATPEVVDPVIAQAAADLEAEKARTMAAYGEDYVPVSNEGLRIGRITARSGRVAAGRITAGRVTAGRIHAPR